MVNRDPVSFLFIIPIASGQGEWPFPSQLKEHLFQNFVRVRGLYSNKAYRDSRLFTITNASEHGFGRRVITNVLSVFEFKKAKEFKQSGTVVTAPINVIPADIKFVIIDDSFKIVNDFNGWIWVEILGEAKKNLE